MVIFDELKFSRLMNLYDVLWKVTDKEEKDCLGNRIADLEAEMSPVFLFAFHCIQADHYGPTDLKAAEEHFEKARNTYGQFETRVEDAESVLETIGSYLEVCKIRYEENLFETAFNAEKYLN